MIKTILFDFGNVLGFFDHRRALSKLKQHTALETKDLATILYGGELEIAYELGQISTDSYCASAQQAGQLSCTQEEFLEAFVDIFTLNQPVAALIPRLKPHYRLVLASNTNEAHFTFYRRQFAQVLDPFDHLIVSHEIGSRKPHLSFYEKCHQQARCQPDECLFVDDLPSNIQAAHKFGWNAVLLNDPLTLIQQMIKHGIQGLDDIL